ncbi:hypothetical protein PROFUN_04053 [Planoprotostelium fungivorum]|uniref:Uncharacterized protein n=1 Tax=Planoprotostelium fungivorum TaxID=1890364 RepID=A0A2P6NW99_9EUKA|nr:hypothetical protein PROFUN_04053 [Planoprotostelium fungivorum]
MQLVGISAGKAVEITDRYGTPALLYKRVKRHRSSSFDDLLLGEKRKWTSAVSSSLSTLVVSIHPILYSCQIRKKIGSKGSDTHIQQKCRIQSKMMWVRKGLTPWFHGVPTVMTRGACQILGRVERHMAYTLYVPGPYRKGAFLCFLTSGIRGLGKSKSETEPLPKKMNFPSLRRFTSQAAPAKKKLVVLGTGWAGFRLIHDVDTKLYDVTVVSPRNHFLFTPLLTSTTVGTLEFRGVIEPIRNNRLKVDYVQANCVGVDADKREIEVEACYGDIHIEEHSQERFRIPFDELVISVGALPNTFNIPGVHEYCCFLKQVSDARTIRNRILECFERACHPSVSEEERRNLLHFVIVGGGPTSVEFAAELHDFLKQDVHKLYPQHAKLVQISLIEAGKKLLSTFDSNLSDYTAKQFRSRNIDVRTGVSVKEVTRDTIHLSDGSVLSHSLVVWSTGVGPTPLVKSLQQFEKDRSGRLFVDEDLRVVPHVWAAGDCAAFREAALPPTAQVAQQQGKYLSKALNRVARGEKLENFHYHDMGMLAYIGGRKALVDTPLVKNSGFLSWIMWNTAYITKLLSFRNMIIIPIYWAKSFVFGRDVARF